MARVVFIHPPRLTRWGRDVAFKERLPHIGLAYVAAAARQAGHEILGIDAAATGEQIPDVVARARAFAPDFLAITANTYQISEAALTAAALHDALPGKPVVLGGYHVTPIPEETLRQFPSFDAAIVGEGEDALIELIEAWPIRGTPPPPGVIVRSNGTFAYTPERPRSRDLDRLPLPAFDAFPVEAYDGMYRIRRNPALLLSSARGCPYQCIFCQNPGGTQYRYRSIEAVMDEIEHDLQHYPIRQIVFTDETFTINRKRTTALCEAMLARGFHRRLPWVCETRVDAVTRELLALLKEAGCEAISFGVEAGNQAVLDAIRKKSQKEEAVQAIRWCRELGIFTQSNFIIGHPDETRETISETIRFALELGADSAGFSILVPFPGTEVMRMAERGEGGLRLLTRDWTKFGKQAGASLELEHLPRHVLERILLGAYLRFYLRPSRWLNAMRVAHLTAVPLFVGHILATHIRKLVGNGRTPDVLASAG